MEVNVPASLAEALEMLATWPDAVPLAGGTDLMVAINFGRDRPARIVPIAGLPELGGLARDGQVRCGAGVTYTRLLAELGASEPALAQAARTVGSPQIRNAGTLGGNLGTCSPAGDTLPVLAALEATIVLRSQAGERRLRLQDFMRGPKQPDLRPGELVVAAEWRPAGPAQAFLKAGTRNAMVIAVASLAIVIDRAARRVGLALGSVGPTIIRPTAAERFAEALLDEAGWERPNRMAGSALSHFGELAASAAAPIDDVRGTAAYRRHIVSVMAGRALARTAAVA
jgi:CO/xanthine dehydrogenase FAD-binding subunit